MLGDENIYDLSDEAIEHIEKELSHAEIDAETAIDFVDLCFRGVAPEQKAKIYLFAEKYAELFGDSEEE